MPRLIAKYGNESHFNIPKGIKLLSIEENKKAKGSIPGSWYIKWDILHYIDNDGKEKEIEPIDTFDDDRKTPYEIEYDESGFWSDSDSDNDSE